MPNKWTIAELDDHQDTTFAILPPTGETGLVIGEVSNILSLHAAILAFIDAGARADTHIDKLDARISGPWLSTSQVARTHGIPLATVRSWMATSNVAEKRGREWYAPEVVIRGWAARWTPHAARK